MCCVVLFLVRRCCVLNTTLLQICRYIPSYFCILFFFLFINIAVFCSAVFGSVPRNLSLLFKLWHFFYVSPVRSPAYRYLLIPTQGPYPPLPNTFAPPDVDYPCLCTLIHTVLLSATIGTCPLSSLYPLGRKLAGLPTDGRESVAKRKTSSSQRIELRSVMTVCTTCSREFAAAGQIPSRCNLHQCGGIRLPPPCD